MKNMVTQKECSCLTQSGRPCDCGYWQAVTEWGQKAKSLYGHPGERVALVRASVAGIDDD